MTAVARIVVPDEIAAYAAKIGQRSETVAIYDGQLISDAPSGLGASSEMESALRINPDWFGSNVAPWREDVAAQIETIYFNRAEEANRAYRELTGIQEDLERFVAEATESDETAEFEIENATGAE